MHGGEYPTHSIDRQHGNLFIDSRSCWLLGELLAKVAESSRSGGDLRFIR
ncbi:Hypothetical protein Cp106_1240 [Corynebacterium pseudotuberculosis 1/06-A]|nr:Hypothetical protein Cp106_1240 [Corynebacterium pseudotuberculosis 1/06-A]